MQVILQGLPEGNVKETETEKCGDGERVEVESGAVVLVCAAPGAFSDGFVLIVKLNYCTFRRF